jgi:hypothetical protein
MIFGEKQAKRLLKCPGNGSFFGERVKGAAEIGRVF